MEQQAEQQLQTSLDQDVYSESDLITLTVPLSLPYVSDTKGFERVDGEITIEGKIYKYVKRAVKNGELVLLCLTDHQKMKLESAKQAYYKLVGDFQQTKPSKKDNSKADLGKDIRSKYCPNIAEGTDMTLPIVFTLYCAHYCLVPSEGQENLLDQPPEVS